MVSGSSSESVKRVRFPETSICRAGTRSMWSDDNDDVDDDDDDDDEAGTER